MIFKDINSKKAYFFLFLIIFLVKLGESYWLSSISGIDGNRLFFISGDTNSYIEPFENLYKIGEYVIINLEGESVYAGRMPVYGALYYLLRFFTNDFNWIFTFQVIVQIVLESIAIICLSNIIRDITRLQLFKYLTIIFSLISLYWTNFSNHISPESIGLSITVFVCYLYLEYKKNNKFIYLVIVSILLPILIGLKPYMIIIIPIIGLDYLIFKFEILNTIKTGLILCFFTFIFCGIWAIRNYQKTGHFYFLTEPYSGYSQCKKVTYIKFRELISLLGHSDEYWEKNALSSFFFKYKITNYKLDDIPTCEGFSKDSILALKTIMSGDLSKLSYEQDKLNGMRIQNYIFSFEKSDPLLRIFSGFKLLPKFLISSGSYYLPYTDKRDFQGIVQLITKVVQSVLYYTFLIFGIIGLIELGLRKKEFLMSLTPFILIFIFCFVVKGIELRYLLYTYPFLLMGMFYFFSRYLKKINI